MSDPFTTPHAAPGTLSPMSTPEPPPAPTPLPAAVPAATTDGSPGRPPIDLAAAADFLAGHGRLLDRRRFQLLTGRGDPAATLAALNAYRNPDGGYGWGLEPDLRSASSQPGAALHAFEAFADLLPVIAPATVPEPRALCDWLESVALPGGGLPFALPVDDPAGCAPFWVDADPTVPSLQITAVVVAEALRVARHDPEVAAHPWLGRAVDYCLRAAADLAAAARPFAIELAFTVRMLDLAAARHPDAAARLSALGRHVPADGLVAVAGGAAGETMRPLDFAPEPGGPARRLFTPELIAAELARLAARQRSDGGWEVDFTSYSPAAALEWRGYATVAAVGILRANAELVPTAQPAR